MQKPFNKKPFKKVIYKNDDIKAPNIMVVDEEKNNLGTLPRRKALEMADERGLDLVQLSYDRDKMISTAILTDYGKYMYHKQKEKKNKQKAKTMKEIKLSYTIGDNDLQLKIKKARELLLGGDNVKISIRLRGRENIYKEKAIEKLMHTKDQLEDIGKTQFNTPKQEGKGFSIILFSKH